jgi:hypothetical protein
MTALMFGVCACGGNNPTAPNNPSSSTLTYTVYGRDPTGTSYLLTNGLGQVTVNGSTASTDADGVVKLSGLSNGTATISVGAASWYASKTYTVTIAGKTVTDNSASPLSMIDQLVYQSVSVDGVGAIQSGVTLAAPASMHFRVQVSSPSPAPLVQISIMSNHWTYTMGGSYIGTVVGTSDFGTKIYDISLPSYQPCTLTPPSGRVATPVCVSTTDTFLFYMAPDFRNLSDETVSVPFTLNWIVPAG